MKILDRERFKQEDTIPKVFYLKKNLLKKRTIIYMNGEQYDEQLFNAINTKMIADMKIEKESQFGSDEKYGGSVFIKLKDEYKPQLISLNQLKSKYVEENNNPTLFFVDTKTIIEDYDKYIVDEKYIMKIEVEEIINDNEGLNLTIIRLITRTEKNLKKANTIYLRGDPK